MDKKLIRLLTAAASFLMMLSPVFASFNSLGIPDSSEIRKGQEEKWFECSLQAVRENAPEIRYNSNGQEFQIRMEESDETFNVFVSPHAVINVSVVSDIGSYIEQQDVYPGDAPGSWVLVRDKKTQKPIRIRYYFLKNSEVFVQFTPSVNGKIALADLVIFGNYAARGVPTGIPFRKFYSASIEDVINYTKGKLPWNYVLTDSDLYVNLRQMIAAIRNKLPSIKYYPTAMYDEDNQLVDILTGQKLEIPEQTDGRLLLSSAGFVKWIADGLVQPVSNGRLKRAPLLAQTVEYKDNGHIGIASLSHNLFFSLDWIRNLASAVISVYSGTTYKFNQSGVDVTVDPFSSSISKEGIKNTVTFIEDTGYTTAVLKSLLYVLAATEPGTFYFGAIRETDRTVTPEIKVFNDCISFFPYFMDDGTFACAVFMNGREISLEEFCLVYKADYVYLTRVKSSDLFFPE